MLIFYLSSPSTTCGIVTQVITTTVTSTTTKVSIVVPFLSSTLTSSSFSTLTSHSTVTNYVTVYPDTSSISVSSSDAAYYYVDVNGTTSWIAGVSPPTTYHSYVTRTIQLTVYPTTTITPEESVYAVQSETSVSALTSSSSVLGIEDGGSTAESTWPSTIQLTQEVTSATSLFTVRPGPGYSGWNASISALVGMSPTGFVHAVTGSTVTITESVAYATSLHSMPSAPFTIHATSTISEYPTVTAKMHSTLLVSGFSSRQTTDNRVFSTYSSTASPTVTQIPAYSGSAYYLASALAGGASNNHSTTATSFRTVSVSGIILTSLSNNTSTYLTAALTSTASQSGTGTAGSTIAMSSSLTQSFSNSTVVGTGTASSPTPTACGEYGDFTLDVSVTEGCRHWKELIWYSQWDDEPTWTPTTAVTDPYDAPPVFNPYHHLYFSSGYVYVPQPAEPFAPISQPHLVMFLTNDTGPTSSPNAGLELSGEIGAGNRASETAFWFNAYSAYLGCENEGPDDCTIQISGYIWEETAGQEILAVQQNTTVAACPGYVDCKLQQVQFGKSMQALSGIRIQAFVQGKQRMWYMDDLGMGWWNNSCAAGLLRMESR